MTWTRSLLREEEHKALATLTLTGKVLDVGGSKKSETAKYVRGEYEMVTANIDASYGADLIFDAQKQWPVESSSFDGVLFLNVLEHLYDYRTALSEAQRALKDGGTIAGVVPFMFNVHGSPNDYFRYTKSALERMLADAGFSCIEVRELGTGAFSVTYHCLMGFMGWRWFSSISKSVAKGLDGMLAKLRPGNGMNSTYMPLGYYFSAKR